MLAHLSQREMNVTKLYYCMTEADQVAYRAERQHRCKPRRTSKLFILAVLFLATSACGTNAERIRATSQAQTATETPQRTSTPMPDFADTASSVVELATVAATISATAMPTPTLTSAATVTSELTPTPDLVDDLQTFAIVIAERCFVTQINADGAITHTSPNDCATAEAMK
jgi:hypothetical protein